MKIVRGIPPPFLVMTAVALIVGLLIHGYVPWPAEVRAKHLVMEKLRSTLAALPKPAAFRPAKFPGTQSDDVRFQGNYRGRYAHLAATYLTSLPPEETCQLYRQFIETQRQWTMTGACRPTAEVANPFLGVSAIENFHSQSHERFDLHLSIRSPEKPPGVEPTGSEIRLRMSYALDRRAETNCLPPDLSGRPWPCEEANWHEMN
jgi:hypothetical protein